MRENYPFTEKGNQNILKNIINFKIDNYNYNYIINNNFEDLLKQLFEKMEKNKVIDTLNKLDKITKDNKFSFAYLAFIIYKNPDKFIESLHDIINSNIISNNKLENNINEIINKFNKDEIKYNNEKILELIKYIYKLLKDKNEEIKNNNNEINISDIELDQIKERVKKVQKNFYSYTFNENDLKEDNSMKNIKNISLKIQAGIKISEEEEKKKNNENKESNKLKKEIIISNKFLIKNKNTEIVDIKKEPEEIKIPPKINNIQNEITNIKIDLSGEWGRGINDWPKDFSINSIIKFLGECIVKIQMLPLLIKDAVIIRDQTRIYKFNFILSDLFNIYIAIKESSNSLLSPTLKEYKDSFESMFYKLKKSGVDFSKDEDFKKLKGQENKIQDFIVMPDRDSFTIRENKLQKVNKKQGNKYVKNSRSGIGSVSDISKMKDKSQEKNVQNINKPKISQKINNQNENKKCIENLGNIEENAKKEENTGGQKMIGYLVRNDKMNNEKKDNNGGNEDKGDKDESEREPEEPVGNPEEDKEPPKLDQKQFENIPCDLEKETEEIIKNMEELSKNKKEKKLKYEETIDLVKRYNNKE